MAGGLALAGLGGALGVGPGAAEMLGTAGAGGTVIGLAGGAPLGAPGGGLGALGKLLGGLEGVVSDFNATAVAALGSGAELALVVAGLGGAEAPPAGAGADGGLDAAILEMAGLGATEEAPGRADQGEAPGATDELPGACGEGAGLGATEDDAAGFGATEDVAGAGATDASGFGAGTDVAAVGAAALGARDGVAAPGFAKRGGAGIEVSPVAGPGPSGATGCTGIVVEGRGGASSRQASASTSKLRSVLRPQIGQSQPTSNRFWCAPMLCAGARSRTRSGPTAKPERT